MGYTHFHQSGKRTAKSVQKSNPRADFNSERVMISLLEEEGHKSKCPFAGE